MKTRKDPTMIGTDSYGLPKESYYNCNKGYCSEIHSLKCERRCDEKVFDTKGKNTFIFNGERIIVARYQKIKLLELLIKSKVLDQMKLIFC